MLDRALVDATGVFELQLSRDDVDRELLLILETVLDDGSLQRGFVVAVAEDRRIQLQPQPLALDPIAEAAVQLLRNEGLSRYSLRAILAVLAAVRDANAEANFAGRTPAEAAALALRNAEDDPEVVAALELGDDAPPPTGDEDDGCQVPSRRGRTPWILIMFGLVALALRGRLAAQPKGRSG